MENRKRTMLGSFRSNWNSNRSIEFDSETEYCSTFPCISRRYSLAIFRFVTFSLLSSCSINLNESNNGKQLIHLYLRLSHTLHNFALISSFSELIKKWIVLFVMDSNNWAHKSRKHLTHAHTLSYDLLAINLLCHFSIFAVGKFAPRGKSIWIE